MSMTSPISYAVDDKDLDDAALWAAIDSAAASLSPSLASKRRQPLALTYTATNHRSPNLTYTTTANRDQSPTPISISNPRNHHSPSENDVGEVLQTVPYNRQQKIARSCASVSSPLAVVRHVQRKPTTPSYSSSPDAMRLSVNHQVQRTPTTCTYNTALDCSPPSSLSVGQCEEKEERTMRHSLSGRFPTVSLFKEYQNAAMAILEKSDYTMISGSPYIKKSGWRRMSFYFNVSYEIKDKNIEFDENRNVLRAEFVVRACMQGGRFSDGWGSCDRREKRFMKPNHDIPSTAETRAKNKACQDLLGIGEYRPGGHQGPG